MNCCGLSSTGLNDIEENNITSDNIPCTSTSMDIHGISMDISGIFHVYLSGHHTWNIPGIYQAFPENRGSRCCQWALGQCLSSRCAGLSQLRLIQTYPYFSYLSAIILFIPLLIL